MALEESGVGHDEEKPRYPSSEGCRRLAQLQLQIREPSTPYK
nr:MAG TPA: hypothetical protein [Caudoviricetes sp.]DAO89743.1 MAG TPA: hypothetical protein [Caudoviricetes sp.]